MNIVNPPVFDHMVAMGGQNVKMAVFPIGLWNMQGVINFSVIVPTPMTSLNIIAASAVVYQDGSPSAAIPIGTINNGTGVTNGGIRDIQANSINLTRLTGGQFDSVNFSGVAVNRGFVTIWYI
jgi:hypothetical protein